MDNIISNVKKVKAKYIQILCYADDAMLFAENKNDLQKLAQIYKCSEI